jgi:antimicrobial peptide system SdpB family protein
MRQFILRTINLFTFSQDADRYTEFASQINIYTFPLGLARSFLALGTLTIFLFNSTDILFPDFLFESLTEQGWYKSISLFYIFSGNVGLAKAITIVILTVNVLGFYPRYFGILHWYVAYSFFVASPLIDGGDQINTILTLLLVPITIFDSRKNHFYGIINPISKHINIILVSFLLIIKIQVAILYFNSAVAKFAVEEWMNGTALYYWLLHPIHGVSDWLDFYVRPLMVNTYSVTMLTWGVIIFEIILSCVIFTSPSKIRYRKRMLVLGMLFHFGIFLVHGLPSFACAMFGALLLFCLPIGYNPKLNSKDDL